MSELVDEGKVRFIGSSNFEPEQIEQADAFARSSSLHRFVSAENEYSLLERGAEEELLPVCVRLGIGVLPYFPLASGLLTGKYRRGEPAPAGTASRCGPSVSPTRSSTRSRRSRRSRRSAVASLLDLAFAALLAQPAIRVRDRRSDQARAGARTRPRGVGARRAGRRRLTRDRVPLDEREDAVPGVLGSVGELPACGRRNCAARPVRHELVLDAASPAPARTPTRPPAGSSGSSPPISPRIGACISPAGQASGPATQGPCRDARRTRSRRGGRGRCGGEPRVASAEADDGEETLQVAQLRDDRRDVRSGRFQASSA